MITLAVPEDHPLTAAQNGIQVFAVHNLHGDKDSGGVYPSVSRAVMYIGDWCRAANDEITAVEEKIAGHLWEVEVNGVVAYEIHKTQYRM